MEFIKQVQTMQALTSNENAGTAPSSKELEEASITELEKLLSIPLESLSLRVLEISQYSALLAFLPAQNQRDVGMTLLRAMDSSGDVPKNVEELQQLYNILTATATTTMTQEEVSLKSKVLHRIHHANAQVEFDMLQLSRARLAAEVSFLVPIVFCTLRLVNRVVQESRVVVEPKEPSEQPVEEASKTEEGTAGKEEEAISGKEESPAATEPPADAKEKEAATPDDDKADKEEKPAGEEAKDSSGEKEEAAGEAATDGTDKEGTTGEVTKPDEDGADKKATADDGKAAAEPEPETKAPAKEPEGTKQEDADEVTNVNGGEDAKTKEPEAPTVTFVEPSIPIRKLFVFVQDTIGMMSKSHPEVTVKLFLSSALAADGFAGTKAIGSEAFYQVTQELVMQAFMLHETEIQEAGAQQRCIVQMVGTLLACRALEKADYERLITKATQYAAKMMKKRDQCQMVALCSHLFFCITQEGVSSMQMIWVCGVHALKLWARICRKRLDIRTLKGHSSVCSVV